MFIEENFYLEENFEGLNAWAKHYVLKENLNNLGSKIAKNIPLVVFIIFLIVGFLSGDYSDNALKEKIKHDIKKDIVTQIDDKFNN